MENRLVKALICDQQVRLFVGDNTKLISDILALSKGTEKSLSLLLGKTISAMSVISCTLKGDQRISLQMTMSNPKYKVFADADAKGNVRGYLNEALLKAPRDTKEMTLEQLIGSKGTIRMIKGSAMSQFTGITDMPYRKIVDDMSHYFIQSEQTQTFIAANMEFSEANHVLFSNAICAQLLPGAPEHLLDEIRCAVTENQGTLNGIMSNKDTVEKKLEDLFGKVKILGDHPVQFFCGCSKEMFYGMLYSLSEHERRKAVSKNELIEAACQICGRTYSFSPYEVQSLFDN